MPSEKTSWEAEGLDPVAFTLHARCHRFLQSMVVWPWPCCAHKADLRQLAHLRIADLIAAFQVVQLLCSQQLVL